MLKHFGIRSWIGFLAVLVAAAGIVAMQDRLAAWWTTGQSAVGQDDRDWRQRELAFLKQLYDRLETERKAQRGRAPASLLDEQQTILRRMEQTAAPIRGKVPPEIGALLHEQPAAEAKKASAEPTPIPARIPSSSAAPLPLAPPIARAAIAGGAAPQPAELRAGSVAFPSIGVDFGSLARAPELDRVLERVQKIRKPAPAKPSESSAKSTAAEPSGSAKQ